MAPKRQGQSTGDLAGKIHKTSSSGSSRATGRFFAVPGWLLLGGAGALVAAGLLSAWPGEVKDEVSPAEAVGPSPPPKSAAKAAKRTSNAKARPVVSKEVACSDQELQLLRTPLHRTLKAMKQAGLTDKMPVFGSAVSCLDMMGKQGKPARKKMLKCWRDVVLETTSVDARAQLQLAGGKTMPLLDFWRIKRLELLRDHSALSSQGGMFYEVLRLGILNSSNAGPHVKQLREGLEDPLLRCKPHWIKGFVLDQDIMMQSLWKRYAELMLALKMLGMRDTLEEVFATASVLPDNNQRWRSPDALHAQLPGLRASPFWDKREFPWLLPLEERFAEVKTELLRAWELIGFTGSNSEQLPERDPEDWQSLTLFMSKLDGTLKEDFWNKLSCEQLLPVTCSLLQGRPELDPKNAKLPPAVAEALQEGSLEMNPPVTWSNSTS
ncbi:unnamed protein product [Polarella glacialis]|uniref:Uncharacterized protein n=1 Tax=Polarella glacialis TaxID=89957 RepID=A0A813H617_POLGL|nr:unnamed protein product [Polarella glacialis]